VPFSPALRKAESGKTHVPVLPITRGPPEHPALAVEIPAKVKHRFQLHDARSGVVLSPNGTNSSGLASGCVDCRVPPTLPLPTAWFHPDCS
jgi:hypothetical protein